MAVPPRLNRQHPLAQGLVFLAAAGYPVDLVTGLRGTYIGSMSAGVTRWGQAWESRSSSGNALWFPTGFALSKVKTQHSLMLVMDIDSVVSDARYLNTPRSSFPPHVILADNAGSAVSTTRYLITTTGGSLTQFTATGQTAQSARIITRNGANSATYDNGIATTTDTGSGTNPVELDNNSYLILFNNEIGSTSLGPDGRLYMCALWNRPLTAAQALMVSLQPQLLLARPFTIGPFDLTKVGTPGGPTPVSGTGTAYVDVVSTGTGTKKATSGSALAAVDTVATGTGTHKATTASAIARFAVVATATGSKKATAGAAAAHVDVVATGAATTRRTTSALAAVEVVGLGAATTRRTTTAAAPAAVVALAPGSKRTTTSGLAATVVVSTASRTIRAGTAYLTAIASAQGTKKASSGAATAFADLYAAAAATTRRTTSAASYGVVVGKASRDTTRQGVGAAGVCVYSTGVGSKRATTAAARAQGVLVAAGVGTHRAGGTGRAVGVVYASVAPNVATLSSDVFIFLGPRSSSATISASGASIALSKMGDVEVTATP